MAEHYLLAIDQGTSSSRAIVFNTTGEVVSVAQQEFTQFYPSDGWVEHEPAEILDTTLAVCREALGEVTGGAATVAGIGITNQRETTLVWDRATGQAVHRAIVWQDRRTADFCDQLRAAGEEPRVTDKTGLLLDPYFSATKLAWILDHVEGARSRAEAGELAFGTVDTWLLWHLTGGAVHATDASNASRTLLYNIHRGEWDEELLSLFNIPASVLPEVRDSAADFGVTADGVFDAPLPIAGVAGDQQAALLGQACVNPGDMKSTYGTGCFLMQNTGATVVRSENRLLSTVAWQLAGERTYAVEGSIFMAGASVQWLRDELGVLRDAAESEALAASVENSGGVYLVPAFTGLGAPHWRADARAGILGLTRDSNAAHIVRATLESVVFQTRDLIEALAADGTGMPAVLRVDGGMVANNWLMQAMADLLQLPVQRPANAETTSWGAACLAGLQLGIFPSLEAIAGNWSADKDCVPAMSATEADAAYEGWRLALGRILGPA